MRDFRTLHVEALAVADSVVGRIEESDLRAATPCAGWTLADLLAHEVGQHRGFAAAFEHGNAPRTAYEPVAFTPVAWDESGRRLIAAFAAVPDDARVTNVEISPDPLPVERLIGAQLLDTVVHTWDIAQALGTWFDPPPHLAAAVVHITAGLPPDVHDKPSAPFAAPVESGIQGAGADPWRRALATLGRTPLRAA